MVTDQLLAYIAAAAGMAIVAAGFLAGVWAGRG